MIQLFRSLFLIGFFAVSANAYSDGTISGHINYIAHWGENAVVNMAGQNYTTTCHSKSVGVLHADHPAYDQLYTTLQLAMALDKSVWIKFEDTCPGNWGPKITTVSIYR